MPRMTMDRREFTLGTLAALAACSGDNRGSPTTVAQPEPKPVTPEAKPLKPEPKTILILGGTGFLGPHVVDAARARGHTVTLFNRGKTHPKQFPDLEKLQGDRDGKLEALAGRSWDAVVDTSGYVPRIVKQSLELLAPKIKHYLFISTVSAYAKNDKVGADETDPVAKLDDPKSEDVAKHYGPLKAACEATCEAVMPGRVANIRPGLIVGPLDPTGRFSHWPVRLAQGGEVLAPGDGTTPTQMIDGRDLGAWIVKLIEQRTTGVFNALGPSNHPTVNLTLKQMLDACNAAGGNKAKLLWVDPKFLEKHGVAWHELPMWGPAEGAMAGFFTRSNTRAMAAGLALRPVVETAKDTLAWLASPDVDLWLSEYSDPRRKSVRTSGISRDKEATVLAAWKAR
jgi:2'-hydroxyisoflavone reductase